MVFLPRDLSACRLDWAASLRLAPSHAIGAAWHAASPKTSLAVVPFMLPVSRTDNRPRPASECTHFALFLLTSVHQLREHGNSNTSSRVGQVKAKISSPKR